MPHDSPRGGVYFRQISLSSVQHVAPVGEKPPLWVTYITA